MPPRLSAEEKAARKAARAAAKNFKTTSEADQIAAVMDKVAIAQAEAAKNVTLPKIEDDTSETQGRPAAKEEDIDDPGYEARKIAEIEAAIQNARETVMTQLTPPSVKRRTVGNQEELEIIRNHEVEIEDGAASDDGRSFVRDDDRGWVDAP